MTEPAAQFLYRLYDDADRLLYVGVSRWPDARLSEHRRENPAWANAVVRSSTEAFPTRAVAEAAEKAAIASERPAMNSMHAAERAEWAAAGWPLRTVAVETEQWVPAIRIAHARRESLNDVVRAAITAYVSEHGHVLTPRADESSAS